MSESASGTVAGMLTFSRRNSGNQVRFQKKQKDVITSARTLQRNKYKQAIAAWNELTGPQKAQWTRNAKSQALTGLNLYIRIYLGTISPEIPSGLYGVKIYGESIYGES